MLHRTLSLCCAFAAVSARGAWADDGGALLARHCLPCHGEASVAPISLSTPELVRRHRLLAEALVADGTMPPSLAAGNRWIGSRGLSAAERDAVIAALRAGVLDAPSNAPASAAETVRTASPARAWTMPASGGARLRTFVAPVEPMRARGVRLVDRGSLAESPIRFVSIAADPRGSFRRLEAGGEAGGEAGVEAMGNAGASPSGALGALSRIAPEFMLPDGFHLEVPAGDIVIETLCEPIGRSAEVHPRLAFIPAAQGESRPVRALALPVRALQLEAGQCRSFEVRHECARAIEVVSVIVKGGAFLRTVAVDAADARLIDVPDFRMAFNEPWTLRTPLRVEAGGEIVASFGFDNTRDNPQQPSEPPREVEAGLPPFGEDAIAVVLYAEVQPTSPRPSASP